MSAHTGFSLGGANSADRGPSGGSAQFSGAIVLASAARKAIASLLPRPLTLSAANGGRSALEHPLLVTLGTLTHGGFHWFGADLSLGVEYREAAILVPFVQHPAAAQPSVFTLSMLADHALAIQLGNAVYGFRKRFAQIDTSGSACRARGSEGESLVLDVSPTEEWSRAAGQHAPLPRITALLAQPVLGRRDSGDYVQSQFDWDFSAATACGLAAEIEWHRAESAALAVRPEAALGVRGLIWRTGWPHKL